MGLWLQTALQEVSSLPQLTHPPARPHWASLSVSCWALWQAALVPAPAASCCLLLPAVLPPLRLANSYSLFKFRSRVTSSEKCCPPTGWRVCVRASPCFPSASWAVLSPHPEPLALIYLLSSLSPPPHLQRLSQGLCNIQFSVSWLAPRNPSIFLLLLNKWHYFRNFVQFIILWEKHFI